MVSKRTEAKVKTEISKIIEVFGDYPFCFFGLLKGELYGLKNAEFDFIKSENWHNVNLDSYALWAISDNGDLLYWNGEQTLIMSPRNQEFHSLRVWPEQLMRLVQTKKTWGIFPEDVC